MELVESMREEVSRALLILNARQGSYLVLFS